MQSHTTLIVICIFLMATIVDAQEVKPKSNLIVGLEFIPGFTIDDRLMPYDEGTNIPDKTYIKSVLSMAVQVAISAPGWMVYSGLKYGSGGEIHTEHGTVDLFFLDFGGRLYAPPMFGTGIQPFINVGFATGVFDYGYSQDDGNVIYVRDYGEHKVSWAEYGYGIQFHIKSKNDFFKGLYHALSINHTFNRIKGLEQFRTTIFKLQVIATIEALKR